MNEKDQERLTRIEGLITHLPKTDTYIKYLKDSGKKYDNNHSHSIHDLGQFVNEKVTNQALAIVKLAIHVKA